MPQRTTQPKRDSHCSSFCNLHFNPQCNAQCGSHCNPHQDLGACPGGSSQSTGVISSSWQQPVLRNERDPNDFFLFFFLMWDLADKLARGTSSITWIIVSDRRRSHSPFQLVHLRGGKKYDEAGTLSSCLSFLTVHCATVDALAAFRASLHVN